MSDVNADVKITLTADDQASGVVDSATANINKSYRAMLQEQNAVGRQYLVNNQQVFALGRAMQSTGRIVDRSLALFNSYNLMQIRIATTAQTAMDAQERLAQTIAEYGANSVQAQRAAKEANNAQEAAAKAAKEAKIQFALMVASMIAQSGTMIVTVIPRITALASALLGLGAAGAVAGGGAAAGARGATISLFKRLGRNLPKLLKGAGGVAAGVSVLEMMGEQTAGGGEGPSLPGGFEQLQNVVNNVFNIAGQDAKQIADQVARTLSLQQSASGSSP